MKKVLYLIMLLSVFQCINSQDSSVYPLECVGLYPINTPPLFFSVNFIQDYPQGPTGICFDRNGNIYISDAINDRLIVLSSNNKEITQSKNVYSNFQNRIDTDGTNIYSRHEYFFYVDEKFQKKIQIRLVDDNWNVILNGDEFTFLYMGGDVYFHNNYQEYFVIKNPGNDWRQNNMKIKKIDNSEKNNNEFKKIDKSMISISYFLFINHSMIEFIDFLEYRSDSRHRYPPINNVSSGIYGLGSDENHNIYWYSSVTREVYVFRNGFVLDNVNSLGKITFPAVHPSGDIYFLDYDDKAVYLYRIKNVWDPEGREAWYRTNAYVTAKELKLRDRGSLDGAQIGMLEEWQRVEIVDRAKASTNIAGVEGRWCKVKTMDGRVGWAFGGYLKEDED